MHIALVATTGVLRNLNHIYTGRDVTGWAGFWIFAVSMVIVTVGWVAATPLTLRHPRLVQRAGAALTGPVQRLFERVEFVAHYAEIGSGHGGYNQDHEFFGYRQSI